ncbi:MAG: HAD family hydrolase [Pirellulales bacterium]|nr:HAD family hydrolase [Pirellulales bacterium]
MRYSAVIFDLDGTLLDTLADIANSANAVLQPYGLAAFPVEYYRQWVGAGLERLFNGVLPPPKRSEAVVRQCIDRFREVYAENWNVQTRPYEGAAGLLAALASRQVPMAVLSNKPEDSARRCVREYFPDGRFEMVLGNRDDMPPKPDPAGALKIIGHIGLPPEQFVYLGDTPIDMQTAVAAGVLPVAAAWGFRSVEELRSHGAEIVIEHPLELIDVVLGNRN